MYLVFSDIISVIGLLLLPYFFDSKTVRGPKRRKNDSLSKAEVQQHFLGRFPVRFKT
jgi:hypothetical protein